MCVEKLPFTGTDEDTKYLLLSDSEIANLHRRLIEAYDRSLRRYNVKPVWSQQLYDDTISNRIQSDEYLVSCIGARELQLIFLYKYRRKLVHKDLISAFVRLHILSAALDQQVRHLGSQYHWNVLNKGAKIPDEDIVVPSAYHYLVSIDQPNPTILFNELKRNGRLSAKNFDELKVVYDNCCATCGKKEGVLDARNGDVPIVLQQGHMDPTKALTLDNTIPQCQYCNQTYGNNFCFNEFGRVIAVCNPYVVLKSAKSVQDEMIHILLEERRKNKSR